MATRKYKVVCEDGARRHHALFVTRVAAATWAEYGHACTNTHEIIATTDLDDMAQGIGVWHGNIRVGHEHPAEERAWVRVDCGAYTALLCCMVVDGKDGPYLDIDVHPFVDGDHATAGVFGMSEGFRANLNTSTWPTRTTSQGWDSANLLAILVGAQASHEGGVK